MQSGGSGRMAAILITIALACTATLVGLAPGALNGAGVIVVAVVGVCGVLAVLFREGFRASRRPGAKLADSLSVDTKTGQIAAETEPATDDHLLRLPRLLFYVGALTLTESSWRFGLGLTLSEIFFISAFLLSVAAVLAGRPMAKVPNGLLLGVALFGVGGLISSAAAASPAGSANQVAQGIYVMLLWPWTGATVLRNRSQMLIALICWAISAAFDGFAALIQVAGYQGLAGPLEGNRATGLNDHPNDLGAACAIALLPALMLATTPLTAKGTSPTSLARIARWGILGLVAGGIVLSASIAAMFACLIAVVVWLISPAVRAPGRVAVIAGMAFALIALTLAGGQVTGPTKRLEEVTTSSGASPAAGSGEIRIKTIKRALPSIESDPIVGNGLDSAGSSVSIISQGQSVPYQVHGSPVAIWYQAGLLGFLGVLIVVAAMLGGAWTGLTAGDENDILIGLALLAAFIAFIVYSFTAPFLFQQYGWFSGVMLVGWRLRRDAPAQVLSAAGENGRSRRSPRAVPQAA